MHSYRNAVSADYLHIMKSVAIMKSLGTICNPSKTGVVDVRTLFKREKQ